MKLFVYFQFLQSVSLVPSVPLSFSSPPTNIHSPVPIMQLLNILISFILLLLPLTLDQIFHSGTCIAQNFKCLILWNINTDTNSNTLNSVYPKVFIYIPHLMCEICFNLWTAVRPLWQNCRLLSRIERCQGAGLVVGVTGLCILLLLPLWLHLALRLSYLFWMYFLSII